jgi:hypothetical protein
VIAQDTSDILSSVRLALIPFDAGYISIPRATKPVRVRRLNLEGTTIIDGWEWEHGLLTIHLNAEMLEKTAGYLIENE